MAKPSDLVRPPAPPALCPTPDKRQYRSQAEAKRAHRRSYWSNAAFGRGQKKPHLYPYACKCGAWHLTHYPPRKLEGVADAGRPEKG